MLAGRKDGRDKDRKRQERERERGLSVAKRAKKESETETDLRSIDGRLVLQKSLRLEFCVG